MKVDAMVAQEPKNMARLALREGAKSLRYWRRMDILTRKLRGQ
jgi:hypothetical protein